jgi:hypothetical protein
MPHARARPQLCGPSFGALTPKSCVRAAELLPSQALAGPRGTCSSSVVLLPVLVDVATVNGGDRRGTPLSESLAAGTRV